MNIKRVKIIAEIGVNHDGKLSKAKKLIKIAKDSGADYVKIQMYQTDNLLIQSAPLAQYQKINEKKIKTQYNLLKKYELSKINIIKLLDYSKKINVELFPSIFDESSLKLAKKLKFKIIKIPSGEITNIPLIRKIGKLNKIIIISSGMSVLKEIDIAIKNLTKNGTKRKNIVVLHANTEYPTPYEDVNLRSIEYIQKKLKVNVGYSDHSLSSEPSIGSVVYGAILIEKHITISKNDIGPDHSSSLEPKEFKQMVSSIRIIEKSMGQLSKKVSKSERKNKFVVRKSIYSKVEINKGEKFTEKNIILKRPCLGIDAKHWDKIIGKSAKYNFKKNEPIKI